MTFQLFLSLLLPWLIGMFVFMTCLKKRQGAFLLALGGGLLPGYFVVFILIQCYANLERPFNIIEFLLIEIIFLIILGAVVYKKKIYYWHLPIWTDKRRPQGALFWCFFLCIFAVMGYRFGLIFIDLVVKPTFPWDGWSHWSAKAKIFYYQLGFPSLYNGDVPFWVQGTENGKPLNGAGRHPYFVSVIQTYTALAWGQWSDGIVNLPWLQGGIAIVLTVIGGLKYFGVHWFPAILAGYLVLSLPTVDTHISLGAYADLWVAYGYLLVGLSFSIFLANKDKGFGLLTIFLLLIIYLTKYTAYFILFPCLLMGALYYVLGKSKFKILSFLLLLCLPVFYFYLSIIQDFIAHLFETTWIRLFWFNNSAVGLWGEIIVKDNWHFLFVFFIMGLGGFWLVRKSKLKNSVAILSVITVCLLLTFLFIVIFTNKMAGSNFVGYVNRVLLHLAPLLILLSAYYCNPTSKNSCH